MNKKILTMVIVIPLIIVLVIGIVYAALAHKDDPVAVTGVEFELDEIELNLDITDTVPLHWEVKPAKATNKKVVFELIGDKALFTISNETTHDTSNTETNGLVEAKPTDTVVVKATQINESATIKVSTILDSVNKTVYTDYFTINTKSDTPLWLPFNASFELTNPQSSADIIVEAPDRVVLYKGITYQLGIYDAVNEDVVMSSESANSESLNFVLNSLTPTEEGTFVVTYNDGENEITFTVVVETKVTGLALPTKLTDVGTVANYYVGTGNAYKFNFSALTIGGAQIASPNVKVYVKVDSGSETLAVKNGNTYDVSGVLSLNATAREIQFNPAMATNPAKKVYVRVAAVRNEARRAEYTFTINNGYNADSDAELKALFNDGSASQQSLINLTNSFNAIVPTRLLDDDNNLVTTTTTSKDGTETVGWDAIYRRKSKFTLNGNTHTINAGSAPLRKLKLSGGKEEYTSDSSSLFQFGDFTKHNRLAWIKPGLSIYTTNNGETEPMKTSTTDSGTSAADKAAQREYIEGLYATAAQNKHIINDLNIIGNCPNTADDGDYFYEGDYYAGYRGLNGISPVASDFELNNVNISKFMLGVKVLNRSFAARFDNVDVSNCAGYGIYLHRVTYTTIKDCSFSNLGHAAVYVKSADSNRMIDSYTTTDPAWVENLSQMGIGITFQNGNPVNIEGNFYLDNWYDGKSPFIAGTSEATIPLLLKQIFANTLGNNVTKMLDNYTTPQAIDNAKFNFGIISESMSLASEEESKDNKAFTKFDFSGANGNSTGHDPSMFWQMIGGYPFAGGYPQTQANKSTDENINSTLVCVSLNAYALGQSLGNPILSAFIPYLSYFYLGINPNAA